MGCGSASPTDKAAAIDKAQEFKAIDGFNDLKLGDDFQNVLGKLNTTMFYPGTIQECLPDLPVAGCRLHSEHDAVYALREGIPYRLGISFNRYGKLTNIDLAFRREGKIDAARCREIFGRSLDWVASDYGPLDFRKTGETSSGTFIWVKSPKGTDYGYTKPDRDGNFVTKFMRVASVREELREAAGEKSFYTLSRNLSIFASYIVVNGNAVCDVSIDIAEPDSVEKPAERS